ncbi:hypothetical protein RRG08_031572 [Elysia crispata]|uniref:PCNA-associated factor histone-like domain-containing protein n=1 Tax=Elysia crispata TaxID=231223 RepID=A0AAE1B393_9GAST|nr:hypothetical protein RRG08_031572 [Elysia crispata]
MVRTKADAGCSASRKVVGGQASRKSLGGGSSSSRCNDAGSPAGKGKYAGGNPTLQTLHPHKNLSLMNHQHPPHDLVPDR